MRTSSTKIDYWSLIFLVQISKYLISESFETMSILDGLESLVSQLLISYFGVFDFGVFDFGVFDFGVFDFRVFDFGVFNSVVLILVS